MTEIVHKSSSPPSREAGEVERVADDGSFAAGAAFAFEEAARICDDNPMCGNWHLSNMIRQLKSSAGSAALSAMAPATRGEDETSLDAMADAIDAARYAHPQHPRERPRPFSDADKGDREYAYRLARAAAQAALAQASETARDPKAEPPYHVVTDNGWSYVKGPRRVRHSDPWRYAWEAQEFADALNAAIRSRASSSLPEAREEQGWQPIKDGWWLGLDDARNDGLHARMGIPILMSDGINVWRDVYWAAHGHEYWQFAEEHGLKPTHWMPLPSPPASAQVRT